MLCPFSSAWGLGASSTSSCCCLSLGHFRLPLHTCDVQTPSYNPDPPLCRFCFRKISPCPYVDLPCYRVTSKVFPQMAHVLLFSAQSVWRRRGLEEVQPRGAVSCHWGMLLKRTVALSFPLPPLPGCKALPMSHAPTVISCLTRLKAVEPTDHGLRPLKP